jgi:hypothetical protein
MSDAINDQTQAEFQSAYMEFMRPWREKVSMQQYAMMSTTLSLCVMLQAMPNTQEFYNMLDHCLEAAEQGLILAKEEQNK